VVIDWVSGGKAAAKVKTRARNKLYPVPEEVIELFSERSGESRREASLLATSFLTTAQQLASVNFEFVSLMVAQREP
jgi:hypothetical protein